MIEVYGIPNCDTVKKARNWLTENSIDYQFQDFKKVTPTEDIIKAWVDTFGLDTVINKRGTTWRKLSDDDKAKCTVLESALPIILDNLSMVKRPIVMKDNQPILIGFVPAEWQAKL